MFMTVVFLKDKSGNIFVNLYYHLVYRDYRAFFFQKGDVRR
jgi:hypothetical protein